MKHLSLNDSAKPQPKNPGRVKRIVTAILCYFFPSIRKQVADRVINNALDIAIGKHTEKIVNQGLTRSFKERKGNGLPSVRHVLKRMPGTESFSERLKRQAREKNLKKLQHGNE